MLLAYDYQALVCRQKVFCCLGNKAAAVEVVLCYDMMNAVKEFRWRTILNSQQPEEMARRISNCELICGCECFLCIPSQTLIPFVRKRIKHLFNNHFGL